MINKAQKKVTDSKSTSKCWPLLVGVSVRTVSSAHNNNMAAFVSANDLEAERIKRKEKRTAAREQILKDAKEEFMKKRKQEELRVERGEDKWVAPGISERLSLKSKKKKKKDKKHKQHHHSPGDDKKDSKNESDEEQWIARDEVPSEAPTNMETTPTTATTTATESEPLKRQDWMTVPLGPSLGASQRLTEIEDMATRERERRREEREERNYLDKPGQHPLELNPYWKTGQGLPGEEEEEEEGSKKSQYSNSGRSWLLRSYKRALERVEEDGVSLEEVAVERWGSLDKLYSLLRDADIDPQYPDQHPKQRGRKKEYLYSRFPDGKSSHHDRRYSPRHERGRSPRRRSPERQRSRASADSSGPGFLKPSDKGRGFLKPTDSFMKPGRNKDTRKTGNFYGSSSSWRKKDLVEPDPSPKLPDHNVRHDDTCTVAPDTITSSTHSVVPSTGDTSTSGSTSTSVTSGTSTMVPVETVTDSQLNALAAKIMKAEMMGQAEKAQQLKEKLERLRHVKDVSTTKPTSQPQQQRREQETIVLTTTNRFGNTRPVENRDRTAHTRQKRGSTHTDKGKRKQYFADDDHYSLKALVERERFTSAEETHLAIAAMAGKFVPASNADETIDDALDSATKYNPEKEAEKSRKRTLAENRRAAELLDSCRLCFGNDGFEKHLLVAVGIHVYLAVPPVQSLCEGHCQIVPMEHSVSSLQLDENVWSEVLVYRKGLTRMYADHGMDVVFMETVVDTGRRPHTVVECVPLPREVGGLAPMYFKKAIQESDEEWSQNKKLVDTRQKGVRSSIPRGLPYFYVEFGMDGGYAHVIESSAKFPRYFGKEVCGGMIDAEPRLWLKPHRESFERQKLKVLQLSEWWKPYDWTQRLKEPETGPD